MSNQCDFCGSSPAQPIYRPFGTRLGMEVWVCPSCGLVQSHATVKPADKVRTLSTDADWGNVRHGKGVRFGVLSQMMENHVDWTRVSNVLDVGANRGDFVLWMHEKNPNAKILAVEPDASVTGRYEGVANIEIQHAKLENLSLNESTFDLVFCSHTLEHAASGAAMLRQIHTALRPGGWLVLEVPNIEAISLDDIVEEFFIDKHPFHFDRQTLIDFILQCGYRIAQGQCDSDPMNITLMLQRESQPATHYLPLDGAQRAARHAEWIKSYLPRLERNRQLLRRIVDEKLRPLAARQKVAYWGAGRIFDALVKYGGLTHKDVYFLTDQFLAGIVKETHGVPIEKPERLRMVEPHVIVILGNSAENTMAQRAYALGVRHVVKFSELMGQVRDL